jgi:hypothetical protein
MPTRYLAIAGEIDVVEIIEEGTGGIPTTFIPKNPVVVSIVRMGYTFVASKDRLFEDRSKAILEAQRLRQEELEKERNTRGLMAKKASKQSPSLINRGAIPSPNLPISVMSGRTEPEELFRAGYGDQEGLGTEEGSSSEEEAEEVRVSDTCDTAAPASKHAKPKDLVQNMQKVIGADTLTLQGLYDRLRSQGLMPMASNPIEYIRYHLSKNRDLFDRPERTTVCLFAGNPFLVPAHRPLPVIEPEEAAEQEEPADSEVLTEQEEPEGEVPTQQEEPAEVVTSEPEPTPAPKAKGKKGKGASKAKVTEGDPATEKKLDPYRTWNGLQLEIINSEAGRYEDANLLMVEQKREGMWTCSITVSGIKEVFKGAASKRRDIARIWSDNKVREYMNRINIVTHRIGIPAKVKVDA